MLILKWVENRYQRVSIRGPFFSVDWSISPFCVKFAYFLFMHFDTSLHGAPKPQPLKKPPEPRGSYGPPGSGLRMGPEQAVGGSFRMEKRGCFLVSVYFTSKITETWKEQMKIRLGYNPILWSPDTKSQLFGKDPDAEKDWRQNEKGVAEDDMVG